MMTSEYTLIISYQAISVNHLKTHGKTQLVERGGICTYLVNDKPKSPDIPWPFHTLRETS
jgi:hypothetical protein